MKRFIIPIRPDVLLAVRTSSDERSKSTRIRLLTSKIISMLFIVIFLFSVKTFSQTSDDGLSKINSCFLAVKMDLKTNSISSTKKFCVGDKITVKLNGNKIRGKISTVSKNHIVIADKYEVDASKIKWIKKSKLTASRAIAGVLVTAAGLALLPASQEASSFDETGFLFVTGAALVPIGIVILLSRTRFRIERGDKLVFED